MEAFIGQGIALVTPFTTEGTIDFPALKRLLQHTKDVDYWVVNGTTAESATLTKNEKLQVLKFVQENNPTKRPIMFGVGSNNTAEVIEQLTTWDLTGVDAILSVCPYYVKPSQKGIIAHYSAIADASPLPILLYNVPSRTAVNMSVDTIVTLSEHKNIFGVKDAGGDLTQAMRVISHTPDEFLYISGDDALTVPIISIGGNGVISVLGNAVPQEFGSTVTNALNGDIKAATMQMSELLDFTDALFEEGNPVGVKAALEIAGICGKGVRLPLVEGSELLCSKLSSMYEKIKISSRKSVFVSNFDARHAI
ncbi:4-hydroxy-tetrahydrodipicolinate synthase [Flammeovirga kamogawensis]|uniref:4-hydroxy-tetrahydrodipicolinate synthase n=1 Tax=Flammeovirga kamogawensis TaxID=373891 RepID=A0ABX8GXV0_9BACT|nr:4-hydroxy-tetrahydrodipicolinate synthase [Flammeovirga kamogawensis]MBB6460873.1 4-hydroxy-tetrahydrodipicolinate synthase [Flammeovirga kamogawensis]QWG08219.1 4-hydroxy-tetrahydrodipicolinate synthase [Flammeovirga kamogawensis]TRX70022.1 4-hydroxy-tetrahydrodipicolinate synthase [Flammeovirga kamogawensis]